MPLHWTERRAAVARIGTELAQRGWTLFGWHEDRSDSMSDYYCPEHWDGIAVLEGVKGTAVVAVGIGSSNRQSGEPIHRTVEHDRGECPHCDGSGRHPSGWTLRAARDNPREYHRSTSPPGTMALLADVVSPIPFGDDGFLRCPKCGGTGRQRECETVVVGHFPEFQPTPGRSGWHVEVNGRLVAKGTGRFKGCAGNNDRQAASEVVAAVVDKIEAAAHRALEQAEGAA